MIKSQLFFAMDVKFDLNINNQLYQLSALKMWDKDLTKYLYVFPLKNLDKVIALVGDEISFEGSQPEVMNLLSHLPTLKQDVNVAQYKGKGMCYIQKFPKLFIIKTIFNKNPETYRIPIETVAACWRACKKFAINQPVKSKVLAKHYMDELGITRFNRPDTQSFDADKLYGTRQRTGYFNFYYSLKVLNDEGVIRYGGGSPLVVRLSNSWTYQGKLID